MNMKGNLKFWMAATILYLAFPNLAFATSCWLQIDEDSARSLSDIVFVGTAVAKTTEIFEAIELEGRKHISSEETIFVVEKVEKGKLEIGQKLRVEKGKMCSCAGEFTIGKKYLVHAAYKQDEEERLILYFCNFNKEVE